MLESFYLYKKQKSIINLYTSINELYTSGEASIASLASQFERLETNRNIDLVIKNKTGSTIYLTPVVLSNWPYFQIMTSRKN